MENPDPDDGEMLFWGPLILIGACLLFFLRWLGLIQ
jgi:hypothetical protein